MTIGFSGQVAKDLAKVIISACDEVTEEGLGEEGVRADQAVRLLVHQLTFVMGVNFVRYRPSSYDAYPGRLAKLKSGADLPLRLPGDDAGLRRPIALNIAQDGGTVREIAQAIIDACDEVRAIRFSNRLDNHMVHCDTAIQVMTHKLAELTNINEIVESMDAFTVVSDYCRDQWQQELDNHKPGVPFKI